MEIATIIRLIEPVCTYILESNKLDRRTAVFDNKIGFNFHIKFK